MDKYTNLSIRARVAFGGLCLKSLLLHIGEFKEEWILILDTIWEYTFGSPGEWHYKMAELTPFSVEEDIPFGQKEYQYFSEGEHNVLKGLYSMAGEDIKEIVGLVFEIGTKDLYSSITHKSPATLNMLKRILDILNQNKCPIPNTDGLLKYSIEEEGGWGIRFYMNDKPSSI